MLGFGPLSSRSVSGSPYKLYGYTALVVGSSMLTLGGSGTWGQLLTASGTSTLTIAGAATWTTLNALIATSTISFDGGGRLRVAGKPLVFTALRDPATFTAATVNLTFTAQAQSFIFRGNR